MVERRAQRKAQAEMTCDRHINLFRRSEQQFRIDQALQRLDADNGRLMRESRDSIGKLNDMEQRIVQLRFNVQQRADVKTKQYADKEVDVRLREAFKKKKDSQAEKDAWASVPRSRRWRPAAAAAAARNLP